MPLCRWRALLSEVVVLSASNAAAADRPGRSARKPRGEGHARRAEILAAAERIFVEHGYQGATIRKIADEVGVSSTALYMHFREKGEILEEICKGAFERLTEANQRIMASLAPPEVRVRRLLEAYMAFGFDNPNAYRLVYCTRPAEARGPQGAGQDLGRQLFKGFEAVVTEVEAAGRLTIGAPVAAQVLWAGVHGLVSLIITKPYFEWEDQQVLATATLDALLKGLLRP